MGFGKSALWLVPAAVLHGCAAAPLEPSTALDPIGRWTVTAVDSEATGGGQGFWFEIAPDKARAQFGCNAGGGKIRIERGWLVPTDWISTVAGCLPEERMRFERRGFAIAAEPMALEPRGTNGLRLRNRVGSISLERAD